MALASTLNLTTSVFSASRNSGVTSVDPYRTKVRSDKIRFSSTRSAFPWKEDSPLEFPGKSRATLSRKLNFECRLVGRRPRFSDSMPTSNSFRIHSSDELSEQIKFCISPTATVIPESGRSGTLSLLERRTSPVQRHSEAKILEGEDMISGPQRLLRSVLCTLMDKVVEKVVMVVLVGMVWTAPLIWSPPGWIPGSLGMPWVGSGEALAAATAINTSPPEAPRGITIMFPGSSIEEVSRLQRTLVEAWSIVRETFVDISFNSQDWEQKLDDMIGETLTATSGEEAFGTIQSMLASLGDPFTRIISPEEYDTFRVGSDGALEGVGLLIASDPDTGRLVVLSPIDGSPAARAGIVPGDELLEINNEALTGLNGQQAANLLRGEAGTSVVLTVRHDVEEAATENEASLRQVVLRRENISLSPVFAILLPHSSPAGDPTSTGYIRLSSFSMNAADEMERAVMQLEEEGASDFILDLRNNPGGLVKSGLEVAEMWLDGPKTLVNTVDRYGYQQAIRTYDNTALTHLPLAVLVNHGSASASEILAGALRDNGRAMLVGDDSTYGKGRIQSVFELSDGSALFVTVAKYLSPNLHEIDRVGVAPDLSCSLSEPIPEPMLKQATMEMLSEDITSFLQVDTCVLAAEIGLEQSI